MLREEVLCIICPETNRHLNLVVEIPFSPMRVALRRRNVFYYKITETLIGPKPLFFNCLHNIYYIIKYGLKRFNTKIVCDELNRFTYLFDPFVRTLVSNI